MMAQRHKRLSNGKQTVGRVWGLACLYFRTVECCVACIESPYRPRLWNVSSLELPVNLRRCTIVVLKLYGRPGLVGTVFTKTNFPISVFYLKIPHCHGKRDCFLPQIFTQQHMKNRKHRRNIKQSMTIPSLFQQTPPTGLVKTGIGVSWNTYADD